MSLITISTDVPGPNIQVNSGDEGPIGLSAYQVALANGFVGNEAAWLASLVSTVPGPVSTVPGPTGPQGTNSLNKWDTIATDGQTEFTLPSDILGTAWMERNGKPLPFASYSWDVLTPNKIVYNPALNPDGGMLAGDEIQVLYTQLLQGAQFWGSNGVPSNAVGINGSIHVNYSNGDISERIAGAYVVTGNIMGPMSTIPGPQGAQGAAAGSLLTAKQLINISQFASTLATSNAALCTILNDGDGYLITAIAASGHFNLFQLDTVTIGELYQVIIDYELIELNCTSVELKNNAYFAASNVGRVLTSADIALRNTYTRKSLTVTVANSTSNVSLLCVGSKLNGALDYYAKVRVRRVSVIRITDSAVLYPQNIEEVMGVIPYGTNNLQHVDLAKYNTMIDPNSYLGYNLIRADNIELTPTKINQTYSLGSGVTTKDTSFSVTLPSNLIGIPTYTYYRIEVEMVSMNCDYFELKFRTLGGDYTGLITRAEVGVRKVFEYISYKDVTANTAFSVLFASSRSYVNGVAGTFYGAESTAQVKIWDVCMYTSQNKIPQFYIPSIFKNGYGELSKAVVDETIQTKIINAYGDSITEQKWLRFLAVKGYDFTINIYGNRASVSAFSGSACDTYGVMTDNADIVVPLFGAHDFGQDCPIGAIGNNVDALNKSTYLGAYETLLRGLINKYPTKVVLPATATPRNLTNTDNQFFYHKNAVNLTMRDYADALISLCKFYGLPYADTHADCGVNYLNMGGNPNLYVSGTATDNFRLDAAGALVADAGYFTSAFITISQTKNYGSSGLCLVSEYDGSDVFIRQSPLATFLYQHPDTAKVKLSVSKSSVVVDGTTVGVAITRFWFADLADSKMKDRIHPNEKAQRAMSASLSKVLTQILRGNEMIQVHTPTAYFNNAD